MAQEPQITAWPRLALAAFQRIIRRDPTELTEIVMACQVLWWGGGLLLPAPSLGVEGLLNRGNELFVGAWFVLIGLVKFGAMAFDMTHTDATRRTYARRIAALIILASWALVSFHFWSRNPWGTGALNYSFLMLVQGFLFSRQVARHVP